MQLFQSSNRRNEVYLSYFMKDGGDAKEHTLLMVLPDHETGALAIHGTEAPGGQPLGFFINAYSWPAPPLAPETHHAGGDVVFWVQGPGSEVLARPIDNTFVYHVIRALLRY